jgi:hypothetical protein
MDEIEYYYKGVSVGKARLPEATRTSHRHDIAFRLDIDRYDRYVFLKNGSIRFDSSDKAHCEGVKQIVESEIKTYRSRQEGTRRLVAGICGT